MYDRIDVSDVRLRWRVEDRPRSEFGGARYYFRKTAPARENGAGSTQRKRDESSTPP
jgi:hypothetical protein